MYHLYSSSNLPLPPSVLPISSTSNLGVCPRLTGAQAGRHAAGEQPEALQQEQGRPGGEPLPHQHSAPVAQADQKVARLPLLLSQQPRHLRGGGGEEAETGGSHCECSDVWTCVYTVQYMYQCMIEEV